MRPNHALHRNGGITLLFQSPRLVGAVAETVTLGIQKPSRKPKCIIITGQPGSGKTTLAKKLGERLRMPVISRDEIKEGYVNTRRQTRPTST